MRSSHPINSLSGPVEDASSHTVNFLPCQVGVYPRKSEGIEPFNLVNSLPGQVEDANVSSHTVNSLPCQGRGLALAPDQLSVGLSWGLVPSVLYSPSLCIQSCNSCTVTLTACPLYQTRITPQPSSVTSPSCFTSSGTASVPLNTTQATSHKQPMALPVDQTARDPPSLKRSTTRISTYRHRGPHRSVVPFSNTSTTQMSSTVLDIPNLRSPCLLTTRMKAWALPTLMTIPYLSLGPPRNPNSLARRHLLQSV